MSVGRWWKHRTWTYPSSSEASNAGANNGDFHGSNSTQWLILTLSRCRRLFLLRSWQPSPRARQQHLRQLRSPFNDRDYHICQEAKWQQTRPLYRGLPDLLIAGPQRHLHVETDFSTQYRMLFNLRTRTCVC